MNRLRVSLAGIVMACIVVACLPGAAAAAYPCSVFRTWNAGDDLTAADMNATVTTVGVTNMVTTCIEDMSANAAAMQATSDPYPCTGGPPCTSAESLPVDLDGEIKRIRFILNKLYAPEGGSWYQYSTRAQIPAVNWLRNPSFEDFIVTPQGVTPTAWILSGSGASVVADTTNKKHGGQAAALTRTGNDAILVQDVSIYAPSAPVAWWQGKTVTLCAWIRATVALRARVNIADGVGTTNSQFHTGGSSFEHLCATRALSGSATKVEAQVAVVDGNTTAQFDGVTFAFGSLNVDAMPSVPVSTPASASVRNLNMRGAEPIGALDSTKVQLVHADEIVMDDGLRIPEWKSVIADISTNGAGGLDVGSVVASTWYQIYAIYAPGTATKNLLFHRAFDTAVDQDVSSVSTGDTTRDLRAAAANTKIGQGFKIATTRVIPYVDVAIGRAGAVPAGSAWATIQSDTAGLPNEAGVLATSDKTAASMFATSVGNTTYIRFIFRTPPTLTAGVQYHFVLQGDFTIDAANRLQVRTDNTASTYANGTFENFDGATWTASANEDMLIRVSILKNDTSVTMPAGYSHKAHIGWAVTNTSSKIVPFNQKDRYVQPFLTTGTYNVGAATTSQSGLGEDIPPGQVRVHLNHSNTSAAGTIAVSGTPFGTHGGAGNSGVISGSANVTGLAHYLGSFITDWQVMYATSVTGTASLTIQGFEF